MTDRIRIAVIGAGSISAAHLRSYAALTEKCSVQVVVDIDGERADARHEEFGLPEATYDADAIWNRDDIDAVSICLPHHLHEPMVVRAGRAGKHVLCEKPFTLSVGSLDRMAQACEETGVVCMSAQVMRFYTWHRAAREFIRSGRLGTIHQVWRRRSSVSRSLYADWYHDSKQGGEIIIHGYGAHEYDILMWLQDAPCEAVYACGRKNNPGWDGHDEVSAIFHLSDGSFANVRQSLNTLDAGWDEFIMAENGCLKIANKAYEWQPVEGEREVYELPPDAPEAFTCQVEEFLDAIIEGREPESSVRQVRWVQAVMEAIEISIREDRVARLRDEFGDFGPLTVT